MGKLTRHEMWDAICSKYPSLKVILIESSYKNNTSYVRRSELLKILFQMKIHKSRHLTKKQKLQIEEEIKLNIINKI